MSQPQYAAASALPLEAVADLYTRTFADYYYAAHITADLMRMFQRVEQINLDYSPVQYLDSEAVGLATVGLRGEQACCKGFGIVLPYRGRGLAEPLCEEVIRQAQRAGAATLQLGVLQENERAVRTYLRCGFTVSRELHTFEYVQAGAPEPVSAHSAQDEAFGPAADPLDVLLHFNRLHPAQPSWAHDLPALRAMHGLNALASYAGPRLNGYILYERDAQGHGHLVDLAAENVATAATLLRAVVARFPRVYRNNEVADNPILDAYAQAGFRLTLRRFEMKMRMSGAGD